MVEAVQTLHLRGAATKLIAAFWLCGELLWGRRWEATGARVALANATGLKVLSFVFFVVFFPPPPPDLSDSTLSYTETEATNSPNVTPGDFSGWQALVPFRRAGGCRWGRAAGGDTGWAPAPALGLCSGCGEKDKKSSF